MLDSEIGGPILITGLGWMKSGGAASTSIYDLEVYVGLCASDQLGSAFDDNWIPWSRTLVVDQPSMSFSCDAGEWFEIPFDTPWWYGGGQNLLIEVVFNGGDLTTLYDFNWEAGAGRSVRSDVPTDTLGIPSSTVSYLTIAGEAGLEPCTLGGIKAIAW